MRAPLRKIRDRLVPDLVDRSYLAKFAIALGLVVLLIGAVGAVTYAETTDHLEADAQQDYTALAELSGTQIDVWDSDRRADVRGIADSGMFENEPDVIEGYLEAQQVGLSEELIAFHYVDRDDLETIATSDDDAAESIADRDWVTRNLIYGDDVYASPAYGEAGDRRATYVTGTPDGNYLAMEMNLSMAVGELRQPTDGSFTTLVDDEGAVAASDRHGVEGERYDDAWGSVSGGFEEVGFTPETRTAFTGDEEYVVAYAPVSSTDWLVAVHVPLSEAYALSGDIARNLLVIIGVAVVGLGLFGATLGRGTVVELNRLGARARQLEDGELDVDLDTERRDEIGRLYGSFAAMRDSLREQIETAEAQQRRAETAQAESDAVAERLETRAAAFGETMSECADGDLTARLSADPDDPNALHEVAEAFNEAMEELEATVAEVESFAESVAAESAAVTEEADDAAAAGKETSEAVEEISAGAERQSRQLSEVAGEMEDMSATIEEVAASADQVATTSRRADELTEDGREAAGEAVAELHRIEERSSSASETVRRLETEMEAVDEIVETISEIADQTNLLALNASIEAARAGEAGSGFAVVAEEVKTLAEETQESAAEVETLIAELRERTDDSVAEMDAIRDGVESGVETVEAAEEALTDISDRVAEADDGVQEISGAMDAQAASVNDVTGAVDELAGISQETTAEASTVASFADRQATTLDTVSSRVDDLNTRAEGLRATVDRFETGTDAGGTSAATLDGRAAASTEHAGDPGGDSDDAAVDDAAAETVSDDETMFGWVNEASGSPANGSGTGRAFTDGNGTGDPSATGPGEVDVARGAGSHDSRRENGDTGGSGSIDLDDGKE